MIEVKDLTKRYGDGYAVNHCTWTAENGSITGFIGSNGAGKTTTLKMITGALAPTSGTALLNGIDIQKEPLRAKQQYGYVADSPDHFLRLKGVEYLNFIADVYGVSQEDRARFLDSYPDRLGITEALSSPILSYSHGMRQKVMILGALIHKPSIWLLDEPMTGLDPQSAYELKAMMREHVKEGNSVLFSTHVLDVAEKLCDKVIIIRKGTLQFDGTLDKLREKYSEQKTLEEIFLKIMGGEHSHA